MPCTPFKSSSVVAFDEVWVAVNAWAVKLGAMFEKCCEQSDPEAAAEVAEEC